MTGGQDVSVVATATPGPDGIAPVPAGANPRLIVLDPGHGGSDTGAIRNGLVEKNLALDIAMRLRTLLVARGWLVKMTHETDADVYGPNASDINELQARV
ncbi:MAG: N-acetylmuramoyl-L-alanine amidase, partial [Acidimicrobiia bacterium]|nr:N-acetylmuramoyl-L-alanine amidase [Acidimicrobiia bacterium]